MVRTLKLSSAEALTEALSKAPNPDTQAEDLARARQLKLTKPPGALGRLEDIAVFVAGWQGRDQPKIEHIETIVFAGNHGVTAQAVSPYPSAVTAQMVANFESGGAAINAISRAFGQTMRVIALDLDQPTADISTHPAMTEKECAQALQTGADAISNDTDLLILGEMGIGNTTIAAALAAASLGGKGTDWAGKGTGLDPAGVARKSKVVDKALALHKPQIATSFELLRRLGGREQAAIAGAIVAARHRRIPVLLDGFIVGAAAAALTLDDENALIHCLAAHVSAEHGHQRLLDGLGLKPLLDLGLRLGEGTGAALASAIVRAALATHNDMATFGEAGVSDRDGK